MSINLDCYSAVISDKAITALKNPNYLACKNIVIYWTESMKTQDNFTFCLKKKSTSLIGNMLLIK